MEDNRYIEVENSPTFPCSIKERIYTFLAEAKLDEVQASKSLRGWVQQQISEKAELGSGAIAYQLKDCK